MKKIKYEEIKKLEYIDNHDFNDNRCLDICAFYSDLDNEFKLYLLVEGELKKVKTPGPSSGTYWSKKIVDNNKDCYFDLIHLIINNCYFQNVYKNICIVDTLDSIIADIRNFGTIIHKQFIIWDYIKDLENNTRFANTYVTELEYLMGIVRSFFDLIYDIIVYFHYHYNDQNATFPATLSKFFKRREQRDFGINNEFKIFFDDIEPLFNLCKDIRDSIYHRGSTPKIIFITENGPGFGTQNIQGLSSDTFFKFKEFFSDDAGFKDNMAPNEIVSVFYLINKIIKFCIESTDKLAQVIKKAFCLPEPLSSQYKLFYRDYDSIYLNNIDEYLKQFWIKP